MRQDPGEEAEGTKRRERGYSSLVSAVGWPGGGAPAAATRSCTVELASGELNRMKPPFFPLGLTLLWLLWVRR